jgi:lipoate-protein ligase A
MAKKEWRYLHIPEVDGVEAMALVMALVDSINEKGGADTLVPIFFRKPQYPQLLLGFWQDLSANVDVKKCRETGVDIMRRVPGGGGMFFADDTSVVPSAICRKDIFKGSVEEGIRIMTGEVGCRTWENLGIKEPFYKHIGDITLEGRKLSGSDCWIEGNGMWAACYMSLDITDFDTLVKIIHLPPEKFADKAAKDMREWAMAATKALGRRPSKEEVIEALRKAFEEKMSQYTGDEVKLVAGELTEFEKERFELYKSKHGMRDEWTYKFSSDRRFMKEEIPEGWSTGVSRYKARKLIEANVLLDNEGKIKDVMITGDYYCNPYDYLFALEESLKGVDARDEAAIKGKVEEFYKTPGWEITMVNVDEMTKPIVDACKNALK